MNITRQLQEVKYYLEENLAYKYKDGDSQTQAKLGTIEELL